jgi:hypothetical protein
MYIFGAKSAKWHCTAENTFTEAYWELNNLSKFLFILKLTNL